MCSLVNSEDLDELESTLFAKTKTIFGDGLEIITSDPSIYQVYYIDFFSS